MVVGHVLMVHTCSFMCTSLVAHTWPFYELGALRISSGIRTHADWDLVKLGNHLATVEGKYEIVYNLLKS